MNGVELIVEERKRQIEEEKWSQEHDAEHIRGELGMAAESYIEASRIAQLRKDNVWMSYAPTSWPFEQIWFKPSSDPIKNLIRAGALIAAEIDRIQSSKESH